MKTEEEARECWCPFARSAFSLDPNDEMASLCSANRGNTDNNCHCIASECMAWRWTDIVVSKGTNANPGSQQKVGFCGLAGKC